MVYKYLFKENLAFDLVENAVHSLLDVYTFIEEVEFDGEYINILIKEDSKEIAKIQERELNASMKIFKEQFKIDHVA